MALNKPKFIACLALLAIPGVWLARREAPRFRYQRIQYPAHEALLYPSRHSLCLRSIRAEGSEALRIAFVKANGTPTGVRYRIDNGPVQAAPPPGTLVPLDPDRSGKPARLQLQVWPEARNPATAPDGTLEFEVAPKAFYRASGNPTRTTVGLRASTLPFWTGSVEEWVIASPDGADRAFVNRTWGPLVDPTATPLANAQRIARSIMKALEPHRGVPSTGMNTTPVRGYQRAVAGQDHVWCGNFALILASACNALGIPARMVELGDFLDANADLAVRFGGHGAVEIFDAQTNRWVLMDPHCRIECVDLGDEGPLNLIQFCRALESPSRAAKLWVTVYDPVQDRSQRVRLLDWSKYPEVRSFYNLNMKITFTRWRQWKWPFSAKGPVHS